MIPDDSVDLVVSLVVDGIGAQSDMASGGAAYKAIQANSSKLKGSGIDPKKLATTLYKKELITPEAFFKTNSSVSDEEKMAIIYKDIEENSLVEEGYLERIVRCLTKVKDERCAAFAQSLTSTYQELVTDRENIAEGMKQRIFDGAKFMRRTTAQAHEAIRTLGYGVARIFAKDTYEGDIEMVNDLDDETDELKEGEKVEKSKSEDYSSDVYRCLYCIRPIKQEEEPVHKECLPNYTLCIRCLQNEKCGTSYYCAKCLIHEEVSICYCCSCETNGVPVHFSCFKDFPWCLRCMKGQRESTKYLCNDCEQENHEELQKENSICLCCVEPIKQEEEPVHTKCLPKYPLCIRCQINKRSDPSNYCKHCLMYDEVYICYVCSYQTNGSPVHHSCLKHYSWCLRCLEQQRKYPKLLCIDCEESYDEDEQEKYFKFYEPQKILQKAATEDIIAATGFMLGNDCLQDVVPDERQTEIQENVNNFDQLALIQDDENNDLNAGEENNLNKSDQSSKKDSAYLDQAIEEGHLIKIRWTKICVFGPPGSGKTSAIKLLLDKEPLLTHTSTSVIAASDLRSILLLLSTDKSNCTWEPVNIKALLSEAIRNHVLIAPNQPVDNPHPAEPGFYSSPHESLEAYSADDNTFASCLLFQEMQVSVASMESPTSPLVKEMKGILHEQKFRQFFNSPSYHFVLIVDTGAQSAFFDIAPSLLQYSPVNIVVHKLDEELSANINFCHCVGGEQIRERNERHVTHQQLITSTVQSSAHVTPPEIRGIKTSFRSRPTLVLGTFYDKIHHSHESLQAKHDILKAHKICEQLLSCKNNLIFPVNTLARGNNEKKIAAKIRKFVSQSYLEADVPIKWLFFQLHLQELSEHGRCMVRKQECIKIGLSLKMKSDEVEAALMYLHILTMILYLPDSLPDCVFVHPQSLHNMLTLLILAFLPNSGSFFEDRGVHLPPESQELLQKGVFTLELLDCICDHFHDVDYEAVEFLQLLKGLAIIVEIPDYDFIHFFPTILPTLQTDTYEFGMLQKQYSEELQPLIFSWPASDLIPQGIFPALIVKLLSRSHPLTQFKLKGDPFRIQQYRNGIQLECESYGGSVLLIDAVFQIEVYYVSGLRGKLDKWRCCYIKEAIFQEIEAVVHLLNYDAALAFPSMSFICTKHGTKSKHACEIQEDGQRLLCTRDNSVMEVNLDQKPWLQKTNLDISDLNELLPLLHDYTVHWMQLGLKLKLILPTLQIIEYRYARDPESCLRECLGKWLAKADNVVQVTWDSLSKAVNDMLKSIETPARPVIKIAASDQWN